MRGSWHGLLIGAPGSHQFAIAMWTLSLNHKLTRKKIRPTLSRELISWMDRTGLLKGESGRIAIAVPFQTSGVIPLVFGVRQHLGFSGTQFCIVTSLLPVLVSREVSLVF